jgi:hypothetical protein
MDVIKKSRLASFINAPLFLWAISAIFITFAGAYYSWRQQCMMDARVLTERYRSLSREIDLRRSAISSIVANAKSLEEIEQQIKTLPNIYHDFAGISLEELANQQALMEKRISFEKADDFYKPFIKDLKRINMGDFFQYGPISVGRTNFNFRFGPVDLQKLKVFVADYFLAARQRFAALRFFDYESNCGLKIALIDIFGRRQAPLVVATPGVVGRLFVEQIAPSSTGPFEEIPSLPPPFFR